jgi:hypothetical protein
VAQLEHARANAVSGSGRLQIELEQAYASAEESSALLLQLEESKQAVQLELALQGQALQALQARLADCDAAAARHAQRDSAVADQLAALRSEALALARARAAAEDRALVAEATVADTLSELSQLRARLHTVESKLMSLVTAAALARRRAVLASLGDAEHCKAGVVCVKPPHAGGSAGMADWPRCFASLSRTGVLQLHTGPNLCGELRACIDVANCHAATTAQVDSYRTLTLTRGKTTAFSVFARDPAAPNRPAAAPLLVACGTTDAETHAWAELLRVFLPAAAACTHAELEDAMSLSTPAVTRRLEM